MIKSLRTLQVSEEDCVEGSIQTHRYRHRKLITQKDMAGIDGEEL